MRILSRLLCAAIMCSSLASAAHAEQYFTVGAGWFDFTRGDDNSTNFMGEWRGKPFYYGLLPVIGAQVNTDGGVYGYVGLDYDWEFTPHWILTPGLAVGAWHDGNSIDLGGTVEFHESLELDYKLDNAMRIGAQVNHTSNADMYHRNPGVNSLMATFSIPFGN